MELQLHSEPSIQTRGEVSWALARAAKLHRQRVDELLNKIGLHVGQEMLLNVLWTEGEMTQTELANRLKIQPATLTVALGRLEKSGFIVRSRDPNDHRVSRVQPSSKSDDLQNDVMLAWSRLEYESIKSLSEPEQAMLVILLNKVSESLSND
jgi:MarR family transcriptional regulator, organic hydroperoxide resistance regulator